MTRIKVKEQEKEAERHSGGGVTLQYSVQDRYSYRYSAVPNPYLLPQKMDDHDQQRGTAKETRPKKNTLKEDGQRKVRQESDLPLQCVSRMVM